MIHAELLKMLQCPDDRSSLAEAATTQITTLNAAVEAGRLRNRGGELVTRALEGGLVRRDGKYLYPIFDGIPVMLVDEAIALAAADGAAANG